MCLLSGASPPATYLCLGRIRRINGSHCVVVCILLLTLATVTDKSTRAGFPPYIVDMDYHALPHPRKVLVDAAVLRGTTWDSGSN